MKDVAEVTDQATTLNQGYDQFTLKEKKDFVAHNVKNAPSYPKLGTNASVSKISNASPLPKNLKILSPTTPNEMARLAPFRDRSSTTIPNVSQDKVHEISKTNISGGASPKGSNSPKHAKYPTKMDKFMNNAKASLKQV